MKDIPGFEGKYAVTRDGRVWSYSGKFLKSHLIGHGYQKLSLGRKNQFLVHRLVAMTYIPNPNKLPQVNHKNGIKTDNRVGNLEWTSFKGNMEHAVKTGLFERKGVKHPMAKLTEEQVSEIRDIYAGGGYFQYQIADMYGISKMLVSLITRRVIWNHI